MGLCLPFPAQGHSTGLTRSLSPALPKQLSAEITPEKQNQLISRGAEHPWHPLASKPGAHCPRPLAISHPHTISTTAEGMTWNTHGAERAEAKGDAALSPPEPPPYTQSFCPDWILQCQFLAHCLLWGFLFPFSKFI